MTSIDSLDELVELVERYPRVFIRYSSGPDDDRHRASRDYEADLDLPGLSVSALSPESWWQRPARDWIARRRCQYAHLADGPERRPGVLTGNVVGSGPDHEPLVDQMKPLGWIGDAAISEAVTCYEDAFEVGRDSRRDNDGDSSEHEESEPGHEGSSGSRGGQDYERDESRAHQLDRNYGELLQELRVAQTGVQILFAFLLGIAFQQRFATVGDAGLALYITTLVFAACASVLLIAPAAVHRVLFRRRVKDELVVLSARLAQAGLLMLGLAILGAVCFAIGFVAGAPLAAAVGCLIGLIIIVAWWVMPQAYLRRLRRLGRAEPMDPRD
jgi:hypothetical protein